MVVGESSRRVRLGLVVLAGGTARRWGGVDKTAALLGERPVLLHCLDALDLIRARDPLAIGIVVAPAEHPARERLRRERPGLVWVRESPPGGGPVAALAAGLTAGLAAGLAAGLGAEPAAARHADDDAVRSAQPDVVVVLAGDLPFAGTAVPRLLDALLPGSGGLDAAVCTDPGQRRQPLLAAYRTAPLARALGRDTAGASLRSVLATLSVIEVPVSGREAFDLDTPDDLARASAELGSDQMPDQIRDPGGEGAGRHLP